MISLFLMLLLFFPFCATLFPERTTVLPGLSFLVFLVVVRSFIFVEVLYAIFLFGVFNHYIDDIKNLFSFFRRYLC